MTTAALFPSRHRVEPGIRFARVARCIYLSTLKRTSPREIAEVLYRQDDAVNSVFKAAVSAGSTLSGSWGEDLVGDETGIFADFAEFLRPLTILGKFGTNGIPSLRRIPFRTAQISQTDGGDGYWVGEGKAKPLTNFDFSRTTLEPLKVANIAVVTQELLKSSAPSADLVLRDALAEALRYRIDVDFVNPAKVAVSDVSPASITNGITPIASSGTDADAIRADVAAVMEAFAEAENPPTSGVWIMDAKTALRLSLMKNTLGQAEFPNLTLKGGLFEGLPVIVSNSNIAVTAGSYVILVNADDIYFADEGGAAVDLSTQTSLEMSDAPAHNATSPTPTQTVSMWQTNSVAFRAERTLNWKRRRDSGVQLLSAVNWGVLGT